MINNLLRRIEEYKNGTGSAFIKKCNVNTLTYYESRDINIAVAREKQIKESLRQKKIDLINSINPEAKIRQKNFIYNVIASEATLGNN